jgi:Domain of unknown function (DUF4129)
VAGWQSSDDVIAANVFASAGPPVTPDGPQARQWLLDELAKPEYQSAKPTWFDLASQAVGNWFASLFNVSGSGISGLLAVIMGLLVLILLVVAFVVFGMPRLNRRSSLESSILDEHDQRDAAQLRASAAAAATRGDWTLALEELFRALAKNLDERTIVTVLPGMTARELAGRAGASFPAYRDSLATAARTFERVRYLGGAGTAAEYGLLESLERALRSAKPTLPVMAGAIG